MTKPSGKPRSRGRSNRGRPSNEALYQRIANLEELLIGKRLNSPRWQLCNRYLTMIGYLDDLTTALKAATYDQQTGQSAERSLLPGVTLAHDGADHDHPDGDGYTNKGNRNLYHEGHEAEYFAKWLTGQIDWAVTTVEKRLAGIEPGPKPKNLPREIPTPESSTTSNAIR